MAKNELRREDIMDAISNGVRSAFLSVLDACGGYPMGRQDMMHSIQQGVRDAFDDEDVERFVRSEIEKLLGPLELTDQAVTEPDMTSRDN